MHTVPFPARPIRCNVSRARAPHGSSSQEMQNQPAEQEEDDHAGPEYPLVLPRPPLDHADGVA